MKNLILFNLAFVFLIGLGIMIGASYQKETVPNEDFSMSLKGCEIAAIEMSNALDEEIWRKNRCRAQLKNSNIRLKAALNIIFKDE